MMRPDAKVEKVYLYPRRYHMTKITLHCLSQLQPRPEHATDHTGKRRGKLTAIESLRPVGRQRL